MHIEVRTHKKQKKYYLAHSFRLGKQVKKIRQYIGSNLTPLQIKEKRKVAELLLKQKINVYMTIGDPFKTLISSRELEQIKSLEAKENIKIGHLNESDWKIFTENFTYDTNAIEGSTVTFSEVKGILNNNKTPKNKKNWEISETHGVADAIGYIRNTKTHLSINLIKKIHKIIFKTSKSFAGKFRNPGVEVAVVNAIGDVIHKGAPSKQIISLLKELVDWYNTNKKIYSPIVLAIVVHNRFETIHPFQDGNGRVGRILLNNILLKHNLPPVNIELKNREEYYAALKAYQKENDIRPSIELIMKEYKQLKKRINKR